MAITAHPTRTASDRAFGLLDALAALGPGPHRLRDVAARAGLEPSTAHRILQAAIRVGTVARTQRGRYSLTGPSPAPPPAPAAPAPKGTSPMLALSRRTRILLAELQKATGQTVLLYVPLMLDIPMRYCLAYFAPREDELLIDAERQLTSDILFCAPLSVDAPGRVMLAYLTGERSEESGIRAIKGGPSPVAGWNTLTAPLRRFGHIAGAVCVTSKASWMGAHRDGTLKRLLNVSTTLSGNIDSY